MRAVFTVASMNVRIIRAGDKLRFVADIARFVYDHCAAARDSRISNSLSGVYIIVAAA